MTPFAWLKVHVDARKTHNLPLASQIKITLGSSWLESGALAAPSQVRKRCQGEIDHVRG